MYLQQKQRIESQQSSSNLTEFLKTLNLEIKIKKCNSFTIPRISQLTMKTNQFNLTTKRYHEDEIKKLIIKRNQARDQKDFKTSDQIRDYLDQNGVLINDTKGKTTWEYK